MPIRLVFRCDYCDVQPDPDTRRTLEGQLLDRRLGAYLDAQPGNWLIFNASLDERELADLLAGADRASAAVARRPAA